MERAVSDAARNLGDGVQQIVMAAKGKQAATATWKKDLLTLLGATPAVVSDVDTLLENAGCEKFVLRCVENELPPNLIHCLRLLRVLELQHSADAAAAKEETNDGDDDNNNNNDTPMTDVTETTVAAVANSTTTTAVSDQPVGAVATQKVSRLLRLLCKDPSVGEQLRPHLFGLLALSGASYPPTGVHVAQAASTVIQALAEFCLTRQLVSFVHERKMVIHMTDDIKELTGMLESTAAASSVPNGLVGPSAEEAGLWALALQTVVNMIAFSCRLHCVELIRDFEAASGYDVLQYAIKNSKSTKHGEKLIDLLPILACCSNEVIEEGDEDAFKLATNFKVLEIQEDLLLRSNPLLREYRLQTGLTKPDPSKEGVLSNLAALSLNTAVKLRSGNDATGETGLGFDVSTGLLGIALQMFSDHPDNYDSLEGRQHVLSYYLLAFPCYQDDDLKNFILKTLEFVLTGVGVADEVTPVNACVEIFFALCQTLLQDGDTLPTTPENHSEIMAALAVDTGLMGASLEKLLQFDQRVAPLMVESGILTTNLNSLLDLIAERISETDASNEKSKVPPETSRMDDTFIIVSRVICLLVAHQPVSFSSKESDLASENEESTNLHTLLRIAVEELGTDSCRAAAGVFEAYMSSFASLVGLERDVIFVLKMLDQLASLSNASKDELVHPSVLQRQAVLLSMLRSVLEARSLARDAFRDCGGFESIIRLVLAQQGCISRSDSSTDPSYSSTLVALLQVIVALLDAAIGCKSRNPIVSSEAPPLILPMDLVVDPIASQISTRSPAALNRNFLRRRCFYLDLAAAVAGTGILETDQASTVLDLCLGHMEPSLNLAAKVEEVQSVRNPDALRLILGVAVFMPRSESGDALATRALDDILELCGDERGSSTLRQLSFCGICSSLTNPQEFAPVLLDADDRLRSRFVLLLDRLARYRMSYVDFIGVLRCIAGPLLTADEADGRIRLPVISSSVKRSGKRRLLSDPSSDRFQRQERDFCERLEIISGIARNGARYPRVTVGGDSINTIGVLMHKIRMEDRLRTAAEQGRLKYIEIESIDASSRSADGKAPEVSAASSSAAEVWAPLSSAGFTFSLWFRHEVQPDSGMAGNFYILDISSPSLSSPVSGQAPAFLSVWYDIPGQRFNVMSSASYRGEPICFPVSPLLPDIWHHLLVTYTPSKRSMLSRKSVFSIFVDGRPLEAEIRVDSVNLPPNSRVIIGAPNPALAASGAVRGMLPFWEVGPTLMLSTVLLDLDATAIFAYGPDFPGLLWGDRPQRLSVAATGTSTFAMLAQTGELGSVASALRRRDIPRLEAAGYSTHGGADKDNLSTLSLLCNIPPDCVIFAYQASSTAYKMRSELGSGRGFAERMVNLARVSFSNEAVSTDAVVYGRMSVIAPLSFPDSLQWAGGPAILMPLVNAASSSETLALALQVVRVSTHRHQPNLEMLQAGGGYRVLAVFLQEKAIADKKSLDECLTFALHDFDPLILDASRGGRMATPASSSGRWVLADLDAMKHLVLNHQVWSLQSYSPDFQLRIVSALNCLVEHDSIHKAFNARRLHMIGVVRWALHLMLEAAELYAAGEYTVRQSRLNGEDDAKKATWFCEAPSVADVSVGGDPGNPLLQDCKNLLRRVLTFVLTPVDLESLSEAVVYTRSISGRSKFLASGKQKQTQIPENDSASEDEERMFPGPTMRLYLVRLLEELIVDGINEIVSVSSPTSPPAKKEAAGARENVLQPHAGGVASPSQPYLSSAASRGKNEDSSYHPKHQQAQAFLSAFAGFLTPAWFATVLEGCHEEASASAVLRLMMLMLQGSATFESSFEAAGGFAPFVLSIPRFSACPGITASLLCHLLHFPILQLHSLPTLNAEQLCEVFGSGCYESRGPLHTESLDPSSGVFALLAECLGRNIQLMSNSDNHRARQTNLAVFQLLSERHDLSPAFRKFCCTKSFLEPLAQALCLVYDEIQRAAPLRRRRRALLADVPKDLTPTERFVGGPTEADSSGLGMVRILRRVILSTLAAGPRAAPLISAIFASFPIHASPQQVEAFHLVLIEQCHQVIEEILEQGNAIAFSNCIGVCSVLLEQHMAGLSASEAALESVKAVLSILNSLVTVGSHAVQTLNNTEHALLTKDAAHIAKLTCVVALELSLPLGPHDRGDEDLQSEVLAAIDSNIDSLLLIPPRNRKSDRKIPTGSFLKPSQNSKLFPLWQSSSNVRCSPPKATTYPDLSDGEDPEQAAIAPLLVSLHTLLVGSREDVRSLSVSVLVALLQHRPSVMSELLVAEVTTDGQTETIDVVNRGGFRALLAAHEAATLADNGNSTSVSVKRKYSSFFEWLERNQSQVRLVFDAVNERAIQLFPGLEHVVLPQDEAVEREQKLMLMRLTSQVSSDRTILGGLERADLSRRCVERTSESHAEWKRQGFDDLSFGAMKWKVLLRQMKGSTSLWEGGAKMDGNLSLDLDSRLKLVRNGETGQSQRTDSDEALELVKRWKLDLTEGHERQRRRLLPNYEFHGLYNLDESAENEANPISDTPEVVDDMSGVVAAAEFLVGGAQMEATADLLKELNLKRTHRSEEEELEYEDADDLQTVATTATGSSANDAASLATQGEEDIEGPSVMSGQSAEILAGDPKAGAMGGLPEEEKKIDPSEDSSSYELITGLLQAGDWPEQSYNVSRCTGLEVRKALLLWCRDAVYIIDGFEQTGGDGMEGKITHVEREHSSFNISLRPKDFKVQKEEKSDEELAGAIDGRCGVTPTSASQNDFSRTRSFQAEPANEVIYEHRSQRIAFTDLYSVYRRRYQLQQNALEFYDVHSSGTLVAFTSNKEREAVLSKVLQSKLPNSIFNSNYGTLISYSKFMSNLKARIVSQWLSGKMTNFDFLMHLNSFAGRSFNDLTQYPVFPWVIADYDSEEIDLDDPATYRDLSKPMGAVGDERARQFQERYEALASTYFSEDDPPPFHYGTHYSCAAYVLYYLMRLEPFSRLALALQGGRFDVADRLFHDVGRSWKSASSENLQDVRELIPEFFYLPDFLVNTNHFDFGETQRGKTVHDVSLPKWAKGDPSRFVRINRQALESEYVSKNLHHWIDLVFGYKQRGKEAIDCLNTFVHVTYEGEVDLDAMTDPVQRNSTIAQIQNFGQTPSRLERKPFPQRVVARFLKDNVIDFGALPSLATLTPPLCVVGAPHRVHLRPTLTEKCKLGLSGHATASVGDLCLLKGQLIGVGRLCSLIVPARKYYRYGGLNDGVSVHVAAVTTRYREVNKLLTIHDALHRGPITVAKPSLNGEWLATGCVDSTVRIWRYNGTSLLLCATLCGHDGSQIKCVDVSTQCGVIVTGCDQGKVLLWDLRTLTFVRRLRHQAEGEAAISVSINHTNGNIVCLVGSELSIFDINGNLLARHDPYATNQPTCAVATDCPEWMEKGIVAVTGHLSGDVRLWGIDYAKKKLLLRHILDANPHTSAITVLRVTGAERQDTLLVGDSSGKMTVNRTVQLDSYSQDELGDVVAEMDESLVDG